MVISGTFANRRDRAGRGLLSHCPVPSRCVLPLAVRGEPSKVASGRIVDRRLAPAGRLARDDAPSRVVVRHRAAAIGRRPADDIAAQVVDRALLRRRSAGHQRASSASSNLVAPSIFILSASAAEPAPPRS